MNALQKARQAHREAVEMLYEGLCTITEYQAYTKPNKATGYHEVEVLTGRPCRLSFGTILAAEQTGTGASVQQTVKLFVAPEVDIKPGSKITVAQNGVTMDYCRTGEPAVYATHQEINLELWKGWT
jgi:hypothetical protein